MTPLWSDEPGGRARLAVLTCTLATFLVNIDNTSYSVALPSAAASLGAPLEQAQWFVSAYVLTLAAGVTLAGGLGDRLSKKSVLIGGLCLYIVGSVASIAAPTAASLIGARVVAGLGGSALVPLGLALVRDLSRSADELRANTAVWGVMVGVGMATGPLVGGVATTFGSWRLIPLFSAVLGVVFLAAVVWVVPAQRAAAGVPARLDLFGQTALSVAVVSLVYGLTTVGHGGPAWVTVVSLGICASSSTAFVLHVRRASAPLLPAAALSSSRYRLGLASGVVNYLCVGGTILLVSLVLQRMAGYSSATAGLVIVTVSVATTAGGWLSGRLLRSVSPGLALVLSGSAVAVGSLVGFLGTAFLPPASLVLAIVVALAVSGLGMGVGNSATNIMAMSGLERSHSGRAGAFASASRQLGQALGVSVISIAVAAFLTDGAAAHASIPWLALVLGAVGLAVVGARVRRVEQLEGAGT